eukprot:jgi/Hompol1/5905/HPOL_000341-RA
MRKPPQQSPSTFSEWELISVWNSNDYISGHKRKIEAITLLEDVQGDRVIVLLDGTLLAALDHMKLFQGSHMLLFLQRHFTLVIALSFVVAMFTLNEFRPEAIPRSNAIFVALLYFLVFSVVMSVVFDDL